MLVLLVLLLVALRRRRSIADKAPSNAAGLGMTNPMYEAQGGKRGGLALPAHKGRGAPSDTFGFDADDYAVPGTGDPFAAVG